MFANLTEEEQKEYVYRQGRKEGMEKGREEGMILSMVKMIAKGLLTVSQAAELSDMTVEEFENKAASFA